MEKVVLGFLDEPSFLAVAPMVEVSNEDNRAQEIMPVTSLGLDDSNEKILSDKSLGFKEE